MRRLLVSLAILLRSCLVWAWARILFFFEEAIAARALDAELRRAEIRQQEVVRAILSMCRSVVAEVAPSVPYGTEELESFAWWLRLNYSIDREWTEARLRWILLEICDLAQRGGWRPAGVPQPILLAALERMKATEERGEES